MQNIKEIEKSLKNEIESEIDKMSMEELLYLEFNQNYYIYSKLKPQIEKMKQLGNEIKTMEENFISLKYQKCDADNNLKQQFENNMASVNKLIEQKKKLNYKISKDEFINSLNEEMKYFDNPESCFKRLSQGTVNFEQFKEQFSELAKEKKYYYYKMLMDKINFKKIQ